MKSNDFSKTLTQFLSIYLPGERNLSTNTIKSYRDAFKQLLVFINKRLNVSPDQITFETLTYIEVREFLDWLETERKVSVNTRNQRLAAIHSFYHFVQYEKPELMHQCQQILGIKFKRSQIKNIEYLTKDCLQSLLSQLDILEKRELRDLTLMATLYDTGARVQELIDLKVKDIRLMNPSIIILTGKGNKIRSVPIMGRTCDLLKLYLKRYNLNSNTYLTHPLFFNSKGNPFTRPGITYILEKNLNKARIKNEQLPFPKKLTPHMMRHTKAIHLLEAGINIVYIRDFLGHVSVTTTERYAKLNNDLKRKALEKVYDDVLTENVPQWEENKDLIKWLDDLCK